jgi:exodeoxyribonuclease-3
MPSVARSRTPAAQPARDRGAELQHPTSHRCSHPAERLYTFWKYFRNAFARNAGLRIDHLLLSPSIAGRLIEDEVDRDVRGRERASDHAPVWIELAEAKSGSPRRRRERDA